MPTLPKSILPAIDEITFLEQLPIFSTPPPAPVKLAPHEVAFGFKLAVAIPIAPPAVLLPVKDRALTHRCSVFVRVLLNLCHDPFAAVPVRNSYTFGASKI